jgi:hypothetical protein
MSRASLPRMTRTNANLRMKKENLTEVNDGHFSVRAYPILDFIRVDSCDV